MLRLEASGVVLSALERSFSAPAGQGMFDETASDRVRAAGKPQRIQHRIKLGAAVGGARMLGEADGQSGQGLVQVPGEGAHAVHLAAGLQHLCPRAVGGNVRGMFLLVFADAQMHAHGKGRATGLRLHEAVAFLQDIFIVPPEGRTGGDVGLEGVGLVEERVQRKQAAEGVPEQRLALRVHGKTLGHGRVQFLAQEAQEASGAALTATTGIMAGAAIGHGGRVVLHAGVRVQPAVVAVAHAHQQHGGHAVLAGARHHGVGGHGCHWKQRVAIQEGEHRIAALRLGPDAGGLDPIAPAGVPRVHAVLLAGGQQGLAGLEQRAWRRGDGIGGRGVHGKVSRQKVMRES